jgi:hypothetical protein
LGKACAGVLNIFLEYIFGGLKCFAESTIRYSVKQNFSGEPYCFAGDGKV